MTLYDTDVYAFLHGTEKGVNRYKAYCEQHPEMNRDEDRFRGLLSEMREQEYDIQKGVIIVNEENFILDGQHRSCVILHKYGPFYRIPVLKCYSGRKHRLRHYIKIGYYKLKTIIRCIIESFKRIK